TIVGSRALDRGRRAPRRGRARVSCARGCGRVAHHRAGAGGEAGGGPPPPPPGPGGPGRPAPAPRPRPAPPRDPPPSPRPPDVLLSEDADGVVEVVGELREPEVTRYLLAIAERDLPARVRARAIGAIEANQAWEREALAAFAHRTDVDDTLRAAAIQTIGAFA